MSSQHKKGAPAACRGRRGTERSRNTLSRRKAIKTLGISPFLFDPLGEAIINIFDSKRVGKDNVVTVEVIRPIDMLRLTFRFHNCKFHKKDFLTYVIKAKKKQQAYMVVEFPSQHTLEQAFLEVQNPSGNEPPKLPAKFIRADRSRLVYRLPMDFEGIPLIMDRLLDWSPYQLVLNSRAVTEIKTAIPKAPGGLKLNKKSLPGKKAPLPRINIRDNPKYKLQSNNKYSTQNLRKTLYNPNLSTTSVKGKTKRVAVNLKKVAPPGALETAIEAPARLIISPNQWNDFIHRRKVHEKIIKYLYPKGGTGMLKTNDPLNTDEGTIVELWHSRLGVKLKGGIINENSYRHLQTIRALWSTDYSSPGIEKPFRASLDSRDRYLLVRETSDYGIHGYTPKPVLANRLMLTGLGAWLDFDGNFDYPDRGGKGLEILRWQHRSTMGRDHYVKVVMAGYLFPFGHKASLVKITERKLDKKTKVAVNRKRYTVVVMEKEKLYAGRDPKNKFIPFPFQSVEILNDATPKLDHTNSILNLGTEAPKSKYDNSDTQVPVYNFWMESGGKPLQFSFLATDREGQVAELKLPLIFISESGAFDKNAVEQITDAYNTSTSRVTASASGQVIAYAESLVEGDTSFETSGLMFGSTLYDGGKNNIRFHPVIQSARVKVKAVEELTGSCEPVDIRMHDDDNRAGLFAELIKPAMLDFNGSTDKSGGMFNPNAGISALSKLQGPIGGNVEKMANLDFDPSEFFNDNASLGGVAKLFGVIKIFELLFGDINIKSESEELTDALNELKTELEGVKSEILAKKEELELATEKAKAAIQQQIDQLKAQLNSFHDQLKDTLNNMVPKIPGLKMYNTGDAMIVEYKWLPELEKEKSFFGFLTVRMNGDPEKSMNVATKLVRPFDTSSQTDMSVSARLDEFSIEIAELLAVNFDFIRFDAGTGKKTKVNVGLDQDEAIVFMGPLAFVNNLQNIIPGDGFGEGPYINLQPTGVKAGFEIGIPSVEVGMLSIANITLGAYVRLPFTGAPLTLGFNFCRRENPFTLTISFFGGGGFFAMETSVKGFVMMEAAFEFGAAISFDVGIASGGVSVMGGFYFKMEMVDEMTMVELTGYIRMNGALSILGLITLSLEFYLALTYIMKSMGDSKAGKLYGEATVKVKVEILFFSKSVSFTVRRTLKGADADPTFAEMIEEPDWTEYCAAFA